MVVRNLFKSLEDKNNKSIFIKFSIIFGLTAIVLTMSVSLLVLNIKKQTTNSTNPATSLKKEADSLKAQAIEAEKNKNQVKALDLYKQAKAKYQSIQDINGVVDVSAKIYYIENEQ